MPIPILLSPSCLKIYYFIWILWKYCFSIKIRYQHLIPYFFSCNMQLKLMCETVKPLLLRLVIIKIKWSIVKVKVENAFYTKELYDPLALHAFICRIRGEEPLPSFVYLERNVSMHYWSWQNVAISFFVYCNLCGKFSGLIFCKPCIF